MLQTIVTRSPDETHALGERWARGAKPGWIIGLVGDLGAGKTQLVKGIAKGLGITSRVQSPTFTLVHLLYLINDNIKWVRFNFRFTVIQIIISVIQGPGLRFRELTLPQTTPSHGQMSTSLSSARGLVHRYWVGSSPLAG